MTAQRVRSILLHIMDDLQDIRSFIAGMSQEAFSASPLVKKAVCMSLINIGELSRELPESLKDRHPDILWTSIIGLRNRAAHGYRALDPEIIWNIAHGELAALEEVVLAELQSYPK